jgi:predicted SAM-dependent methyltransferase
MYNTLKTWLPRPVKSALKQATRGAISSDAVHRAARELLGEIRMARMAWASQQRLRALSRRRDLKVHLGCGPDIRPGWVNIDMALRPPHDFDPAAHAGTLLVSYDLRQGLPLDGQSCALIYSSHFFEHLEYRNGAALLRDCYRVLKPGGVLRLCMPNYRACFEAYLQHDCDFFRLVDYGLAEPETRTLGDYMTYSLYQFGEHKCFYDEERFQVILSKIGFSVVTTSTFTPEFDIDSELRRKYSYYIQAVK